MPQDILDSGYPTTPPSCPLVAREAPCGTTAGTITGVPPVGTTCITPKLYL